MKFRLSTLMGAAAALALSTGLALAGPGEPGHSHKSFAAGEPGDPKKPVARTIEVTMKETDDAKMLFEPNQVEIKRGEQVKFVLKNARQGRPRVHARQHRRTTPSTRSPMEKNPDMEHDDPNGKRLAPERLQRDRLALHQARHLRVRLPDPGPLRVRHARHRRRQVTAPIPSSSRSEKEFPMKRIAIGLIAALSLSGAALAQGLPTVSGTVEKVDTAQGKITIDHGPIKNLDMEAMTMVFRAQDPALLKGVKAGDKVQFTADRVNGQISVTSIKKGS